MFNIYIIFVDDWIRTADLWYQKQPLHQLSHNHCPERKREREIEREREREEGKLERERDIEKLVTCLTETEED